MAIHPGSRPNPVSRGMVDPEHRLVALGGGEREVDRLWLGHRADGTDTSTPLPIPATAQTSAVIR